MAQVKRYKYQLYKMLKLIIEMLEFQKLGTSEAVDIAKGKYKIPNNLKEFKNQVKWQLQRQ
jgi:hypothetical protein